MSVLTPNMNLIQSTVGVDSGLSWEQNLNASLNTLDGHNHTAGSGLQINPSGIYINSELAFNSNAASALAYVNFTAQGGSIPAPIDLSLYADGGELFYLDGSGNAVQITKTGSVNATSSGISSGTATASFVANILVVDQSAGVGAAIDAATYILRYNGSYPSPAGNYIALQAPASLSSPYAITFPPTTPATSNALLTSDTSGTQSYTHIDNATLSVSASVISVATSGIQTANLAAASVTGPKLAAVNYQKSASVTKTTTGGLGIVTGLAVTITTTGRPVMVFLQTASWTGSNYGYLGAYSGVAHFNIYRSDVADYISGIELRDNFANNNGTQYAPGSVSYLDFPSAGTYTYQIYLGANGGSEAQIQECVLVAYEVF